MDRVRTSPHRLTRTAISVSLWLAALIRILPDDVRLPRGLQAFLNGRLELLADFVVYLVLRRAAANRGPGARQRDGFAAARAAARHDVRQRIAHDMRATIGAHLRRSLKGRGFKARAAAILHALQKVNELAARFGRRMKDNLSRRAGLHTRALAHPADINASGAARFAHAMRGVPMDAARAGPSADTS